MSETDLWHVKGVSELKLFFPLFLEARSLVVDFLSSTQRDFPNEYHALLGDQPPDIQDHLPTYAC